MGKNRRQRILNILNESTNPWSANQLAKRLRVSRQVIVGDVALLRAEGSAIIATGKGYLLDRSTSENRYIIAVQHTPDQTRHELELIVAAKATIINVMVEHPVYGELMGNLNIKNTKDIDDFVAQEANLLSSLTDGIHLHTILCDDDHHYQTVCDLLKSHNYLIHS